MHPGDGVAMAIDGSTTLRAAVMEANALKQPDTIVVPAGTYRLTRLAEPGEDDDAVGDLDVFDDLTIQGAGAGQTTIDGQGFMRVFDAQKGEYFALADATLAGGSADDGAGIRVRGDTALDLDRLVVRDHHASVSGGALAASAGAGEISIDDCFFHSNSAADSGGAIFAVDRAVAITGTTFSENLAFAGGALAMEAGQWLLLRSTLSENVGVKRGGAIDVGVGAQLSIASSTIAANESMTGGGLVAGSNPDIVNSIIAGNMAGEGPDVGGSVASLGFNLIGDATGSTGFGATGDQFGNSANPIDARLLPLSIYGGMTPTRLPLPDSPALNAGLSDGGKDQRGIPRPAFGADIGAVEARTFTLSRLAGTSSAAVGTAFAPLRVQFREGDLPVPGVVVNFSAPANGATGSFAGPSVVITDANGIAAAPTFTANTIPGPYTVRASIAGSVFIDFVLTNLPGPLATIDVQSPSTAVAGDPANVTLTIRDTYGNLATNFHGRIFIASTDPNAIVPEFVDFTAANHGVLSFSVEWRTSGSRQLTFTGNGITASASTTVTAASAAEIDVSAAATIRAGDPMALTLTMRDAFGNIATTFHGPVTFLSTDPRATLPAGVSFSTADQGQKTVSLRLRTAGTTAITISSGGVEQTANVSVTPAAAVSLDLTGPVSARAGDSFLLTATARDAFGNVAIGFTGLATFLGDDPNATLPSGQSFTAADAGIKQFPVTFRTAGSRSVTLGAGGLTKTFAMSVTPGALNHFVLTAPTSVNEGDAFAVTVRAFDAFGNVATNYVGTVSISSGDARAELPAPYTFVPANAGQHTFDGVKFRSPGSQSLRLDDIALDVTEQTSVSIANLGPRDLDVVATPTTLNEGEWLTFSGTFANIDPTDSHTVIIRWGDGAPDTRIDLASGIVTFGATHLYQDDLQAEIEVTVTDSQGDSIFADRSVTIQNVAPTVTLEPSDGSAVNRIGEPFTQSGQFVDPGRDIWSATVDYGDGTGPQPLALSSDKRFLLQHVYTQEGTFPVVVNLMDDDGGRTSWEDRVAVLLPGTGAVRIAVIEPGQIGRINTSTYNVEFENNSDDSSAVVLAALVDVATLEQLPDSPSDDPNAQVIVVDFRVLDADPDSKLKIVFNYEPTGVPPEVKWFDPVSGEFRPFRGSTRFADSFVIDPESKTVTITIDGSTSSPTLSGLTGTLFTLTVPTPQQPDPPKVSSTPPPAQQAFFVQTNGINTGSVRDAGGLRPTPATTALSAGGELTLTLASSDGLRRGGGSDSGTSDAPRMPPVLQFIKDLFALRGVIYEAYRMWLEHPAPIAAPALLPPPQLDELELWQVQLDAPAPELREDEPVEVGPAADAVPPIELETPNLLIDASQAIANRQPWWLADAAPAAPGDEEQVPLPQVTSQPSESERTAAALAGIWIGGHALAMSAPHVPEEEPGKNPRRTKLKIRGKEETDA